MKHKENYCKSFITLLSGLKRQYPNRDLSIHLAGALDEYDGKFWGISDKELYRALEKYAEQVALDHEPEDITQIYEDALNLDITPYQEEENDY